jgi:hypothetical protein
MAVNNPAAASKGSTEIGIMTFPPIVHLGWGAILLVGNIAGNMMQVQSTESWFLGTGNAWRLNFGIWAQWGEFAQGHMSTSMMIAFIAAWGAQFILMTSKIGTGFVSSYNAQKNGTSAHNVASLIKEAQVRMGIWNFLAWAIIVFDSGTDWNFSSGVGMWQQCFFVAVTFLTTFYFGTWGIMNIVAGISGMRK